MPRPRGKSWRAAYLWALEAREAVSSPGTIKYRQEPAAAVRVDFSDQKRDDALSVVAIVSRHDSTGYVHHYALGLIFDAIPGCYQGRVKVDIREAVEELRRNALIGCPECDSDLTRDGDNRDGNVTCLCCGWNKTWGAGVSRGTLGIA